MKTKFNLGGGGCFGYLAILISQISKREEAIVRGDLIE